MATEEVCFSSLDDHQLRFVIVHRDVHFRDTARDLRRLLARYLQVPARITRPLTSLSSISLEEIKAVSECTSTTGPALAHACRGTSCQAWLALLAVALRPLRLTWRTPETACESKSLEGTE